MILQERDKKILEFVEKFKVVTTSHIEKEFFAGNKQSARIARRRLKKLYDNKFLKRERNNINAEYIYYFRKPIQIRHQLLVIDFYQAIKKYGKIIEFTPEKTMEDIRPDAVCKIARDNHLHLFCVEIELSNNTFNQTKYEQFYASREYKKWFQVFPKVIIISNRIINIKESKIKFIQISTDLIEIQKIFI